MLKFQEGRVILANIINGHLKSTFSNFSVETVRNLLETDNKGIAKLCAQVSLMPKKDDYGRTYFTKDDVEILRRVKAMNQEVTEVKKTSKKSYATVPVESKVPDKLPKPVQKITKQESKAAFENSLMENIPPVSKALNFPVKANSMLAAEKLSTSFSDLEKSLTDKMSRIIEEKLDEKLDGMDEVVVELVRCKTENETLRYKMNELNKELYNLKNELSRFKSLGMGFYVKSNGNSSVL